MVSKADNRLIHDSILGCSIRDFLLGIQVSGDRDSLASQDCRNLTDAERLRIVHDILTGPPSEGGVGISPSVDPFVKSIFPLHDDQFDKVHSKHWAVPVSVLIFPYIQEWIRTWSKKWLIDTDDLTNIRNHFGEKVILKKALSI